MRFSTFLAALLPFGVAMAETITVKVGENGTLTYNPSEVTAQNGDVIQFQFLSKNHTVTQSTFNSPCTNFSDNGLDSGFQFVPAGATTFMQYSFTMTNVTGPLWFYCRQTGHCAQGMVFAVNPTANKTFDMFKANALASANATTTSTNGTTSSNSTSSSNSSASMSGSGSASMSGSASPSGSPTAQPTTNGAMTYKAGGAILLSGLGLVAGLVL